MSTVLLRERRGDIECLTVNRPEKRNALNLELVTALHRALDDLTRDRSLRAVVIAGSGEHFMAGADIAELRDRGASEALESINGSLFRRVEELPVPVIAALRGFALGGGCELAIACDLRVAAPSTRMGQPEVSLGILPGAGATHRLPRLIGLGRAKELILTGRLVGAEEALAMGLVNRIVPETSVLEEARQWAETIAAQGGMAIRLAKVALNAQRHQVDTSGSLEALAQAFLFESNEKKTRMTAFLDKKSGEKRSNKGP
jgi:enoyl-CoA hydratase